MVTRDGVSRKSRERAVRFLILKVCSVLVPRHCRVHLIAFKTEQFGLTGLTVGEQGWRRSVRSPEIAMGRHYRPMKGFASTAAPQMGAGGGVFSGMVPLRGDRTARLFARQCTRRSPPKGAKLVLGDR
jgi:hypothetical protein